MKRILFLLISLTTLAGYAQYPISSINITMPASPAANISYWGSAMPPVMITAQAQMRQGQVPGDVQESRILVTIKQGGSKKYGAFTQDNAPSAGFTTAVKTWSGAAATGLLGKDIELPPGSYELCVQFFSYNTPAKPLSNEVCKTFTVQGSKDEKYNPPVNVAPVDKKVFTEKEIKEPMTFRWTPILPRPQVAVVYKLKVWQIMQGQTASQAMQSSLPIIEEEVRGQTQFMYRKGWDGKGNWVWRVEATDGQGKVWGVSEATGFGVSNFTCDPNLSIKATDSVCLGFVNGMNKYHICFDAVYSSANIDLTYGDPSSGIKAYLGVSPFTNYTITGVTTLVSQLHGTGITTKNYCFDVSVPLGVTTIRIGLQGDDKNPDPVLDCKPAASYDVKLPNCACNPCKDKQTSFGKDSSNSNNIGQVNMLSTVSHGPNKVIKVSAQIVNFERLGENGCLRCTKDSKEFGNYIGGSLNGNGGIIVKGSYGKQIQWQFTTPTSVSGFSYDLNMMFPPLTDVSCCKDSIRICTRWSFTDEKCIACDTLICKVIVREYKVPPPFNPHGGGGIYATQIAKMGEPYNSWYTQKGTDLPKNFTEQANELYRTSNLEKEIELATFTENLKQTFTAIQNLKATSSDGVWNAISSNSLNTQCGNGDFETGLNTSEWSGAYGTLSSINNPSTATYTNGFNPLIVGPYLPSSNHSIVNYAAEPIVPGLFTTTNPLNLKSFRLGNAVNGAKTELISKKFTVVGTGIIKFMYALVLQNPNLPPPGHASNIKSSFWVKIYDNTGIPIMNKVYLDLSPIPLDNVYADINPFFQNMTYAGENLTYRDWTCAKIDLSQYIGQTVSVALINTDCNAGGHFGYTYIDNWCGDCSGASTGAVNIKPIAEPCIDKNPQVCVDYTLPKIGATTGSGIIKLEFYQNGVLVPGATLTSPTLTSGTTYCFTVNPAKLPCNGKGYDVVATGNFMVGSTPITVTSPDPIGAPVVGIVPGQNNDLYCCVTLAETCCLNFKKTVTATTTMVGNATSGYNTIKILPTFIAGPKPIKKVVISIVNFETNSSNKECLTCESSAGNYGSMYVPNSPVGSGGKDPIEGMTYPSLPMNYTCLGCPPVWQTGLLTHEVTWGSNSGPGYDLMDGIGDQSTTFFVRFPKKSTLSCCDDTIKVCVKYSFTDIECKTCDTIICYKVINRQNVSTSSALSIFKKESNVASSSELPLKDNTSDKLILPLGAILAATATPNQSKTDK